MFTVIWNSCQVGIFLTANTAVLIHLSTKFQHSSMGSVFYLQSPFQLLVNHCIGRSHMLHLYFSFISWLMVNLIILEYGPGPGDSCNQRFRWKPATSPLKYVYFTPLNSPCGCGDPSVRLGSRIGPHRHRVVVEVHWRGAQGWRSFS